MQTSMAAQLRFVLAVSIVSSPACAPDPGTDASSSGTAATTGSGTMGTPTTGAPTPSTTGDASSTGDGVVFIARPDTEPPECDLEDQNCPAGQKCNPSGMGCGAIHCGDPICVPLVRDPQLPGAACSLLGDDLDGTDDCELGSVCLHVGTQPIGRCHALCNVETHEPIDTSCPGDEVCLPIACQSCFWSYCDKPCDPRDPDTCAPDNVCIGLDETLGCVLDASGEEGQAGDPCAFINACDPGLSCANAKDVVGCTDDSGCCSPFCSTDQPNTCPGKADGEVCEPWFAEGDAPAGLATLGLCTLP